MAEYVVVFRAGKRIAIEGESLQFSVKEGSDTALIFVSATGNVTVAVFPADAVAAVYRKDTYRNPLAAPQEDPPRPAGAEPQDAFA